MKKNLYQYKFKKVAVLGDGVMGAQIACHLANLNIPVVMLGLYQIDEKRIKSLIRMSPPPLALPEIAKRIKTGIFDKDFKELRDCDLIIEAIIENIESKKSLFERIAPFLKDETIIASNTSGLSINSIALALPEKIRKKFFGIHFFNPPRFMSLVEIIATEHSDKNLLEKLEGFITAYLGKEVVHAFDTAGFIANRIGVFALLATLYHAQRLGIQPDQVDELTGKLIGKAKSATYRTADIVGLDIMKNVVDNLKNKLPDDPWNKYMALPNWIEKLIADGHLGSKTKQGIYHKRDKDIFVFDTNNNDYRLQKKNTLKEFNKKIKKGKNILSNILDLHLEDKNNIHAEFLWSISRDVMHYSAYHLKQIADNVADIDRALTFGFGWENGVFEAWDLADNKKITSAIENDIKLGATMVSNPLPNWVKQNNTFYENKKALAPKEQKYKSYKSHFIYSRQLDIESYEILQENEDIVLRKLEDGIAVIYFKTKLNALGYGVISSVNEALDYLEENNYFSLILWSKKLGTFCAGANLFEVLSACKLGRLHDSAGLISKVKQKAFETMYPNLPKLKYQGSLKSVVKLGQDLVMRMKHGHIYTISAVDGLALGGGCELVLHSDHTVATMNSFIGLVEVGVGVLPAFGGSKEMILRSNRTIEPFKCAAKYFEQIAMAKISSSALEAIEMGYLKQDDTTIVSHPNELLFTALEHAKNKINTQYMPPQLDKVVPIGQSGKANMLGALINFYDGHFISSHDKLICENVANVFSGGVEDGIEVTQSWLLKLERLYFMKLVETIKTQNRIEHILKTGKPLRN